MAYASLFSIRVTLAMIIDQIKYSSCVLIFACVRLLAATVSKKCELREEAVEALADELKAAAESALAPGGPSFLPLRCCARCNFLPRTSTISFTFSLFSYSTTLVLHAVCSLVS